MMKNLAIFLGLLIFVTPVYSFQDTKIFELENDSNRGMQVQVHVDKTDNLSSGTSALAVFELKPGKRKSLTLSDLGPDWKGEGVKVNSLMISLDGDPVKRLFITPEKHPASTYRFTDSNIRHLFGLSK